MIATKMMTVRCNSCNGQGRVYIPGPTNWMVGNVFEAPSCIRCLGSGIIDTLVDCLVDTNQLDEWNDKEI